MLFVGRWGSSGDVDSSNAASVSSGGQLLCPVCRVSLKLTELTSHFVKELAQLRRW